ncbi:MAG: succinic semialdehyde dehydrogenase [Phototrophicaceae bacterium]
MAIAEHAENHTDERDTIDVINPVTQEIIGQIAVTSPEGVADAVERARFSQKTWGALTVKERIRFIRRWLDLLWEHQSEGIQTLRRENGKTDGSAFIEFVTVDNVGQYYINHAEKMLKPERRNSLFPVVQWAKVFHKPHGVVGIITPWNYPFAIPFIDMIPALIAGNTVVLKPSESTPFIAEWGVNLMYEAGIPRDVVQVVQGDGRTGGALVNHVDYLQFTGSTATGLKVGHGAVERLIPYTLELGGKDPAIVLNDADPDITAVNLIQGAFENSGQMCISIERVYVEAGIYEPLLENLKKYASKITQSSQDGFDVVIGSMTNQAELDRTKAHLDDAVKKGAKIISGGNPRPDLGALFFEPTILIDVDHTMDIMRDETFGPVMPIMKVKDSQEAVRLANDTDYGLSASIYSSNLKRSQEIALKINSGDVSVNRAQYVTGTPSLPSGGQGTSGTGRRNGREGLLKYTATQSIMLDNLIGAEKSLMIATPFAVRLIKTIRKIRRYIPFI